MVPKSIRSRLLLLMLSVLLPALGAAAWVIAQARDAEQASLAQMLRSATRALATAVEGELTQRAVIARVLAVARALEAAPDIAPADLAVFEGQSRRAMAGLQGWVELRSPSGLLLSTRRAPAAPGVAGLVPDPAGGEPHAALVQPVLRDGRSVLDVAVTILPAELQRVIDLQQLPADAVAAVIDERGRILARHPGGAARTGPGAAADLGQRSAAGPEAVTEPLVLDGVPMTAFRLTSAQGWTYVTAVPRAQLAGFASRSLWPLIGGALALLGLAAAAALWLARGIGRSVVQLRDDAHRLKAGQPLAPFASGIEECDAVHTALQVASASIRDARAQAERDVAEAVARTREAEQLASHAQRVEALGRLTGGVAHDFNNVLGIISNSAHLLQRNPAGVDAQLPLAAILRAVEVGSRLTRTLLRFARRQPLRAQVVDLAGYLADAKALLQTIVGSRIGIAVGVAAGTWRIAVDSSELELALINLALNARDAMPRGGQIRLQASNADAEDAAGLAPGRYVLLNVSDDGQGMADGVAARVFEPFFTTKPVGEGTGLGLSQVHGFCAQAGGTARIASTPGVGTTVSLLLPASEPPGKAGATDAAEALRPAGDARYATLAGARVLLVEDNAELAEVTAALLAAHGCSVTHARHGDEALRLIGRQAAFDVVLSDVVMPGEMNGVSLARSLRERPGAPPVVLISAYHDGVAQPAEFTTLYKPCAQDELLATLQHAVAGARSRREADGGPR